MQKYKFFDMVFFIMMAFIFTALIFFPENCGTSLSKGDRPNRLLPLALSPAPVSVAAFYGKKVHKRQLRASAPCLSARPPFTGLYRLSYLVLCRL